MENEKGALMAASLEEQINKFETALAEMRDEIRVAHEAIRALRDERRLVQELLKADDIKKMVTERVSEVVKAELDRLGPEMREYTNQIYDRVGKQIDILIDLSLGKENSKRSDTEDLRPALALHLRKWLKEEIQKQSEVIVIEKTRET
ncbi:MAG TPA: hypothetical protein VLH19_04050 [Patescibacteria group bacterium]|nr:hypothetical protein [Patescibacteria group bacterium]